MANKRKNLPKFRSGKQEREFWATHDSTDFIDWSKAKRVDFPDLKPSTKTISLRVPESLLVELKIEANRRDVPYQSYMKMLVAEALKAKKSKKSDLVNI